MIEQFQPFNSNPEIVVIGAGLAGSEAAWQAAQAGAHVTLYEMRPGHMTPAHETDRAAELVCSNSLGSNLPDRALGLLKNELRRLGSLIIACADRTAVPAGDALAVGRQAFSQAVTEAIGAHPRIAVRREEVTAIPAGTSTVIATGPLTSPALAEAIRDLAGHDYLHFFDAMAPIVAAESVDMAIAWRENRWARGQGAGARDQGSGVRDLGSGTRGQGSGTRGQGPDLAIQREGAENEISVPDSCLLPPVSCGDYINCPLNRDEYFAFVEAVNSAEKIRLHDFEAGEAARRYFEACLPIEVLAARDPMALAFGPMTPMGLRDPRTGRRPFAAVQLRQDDIAGTLYNMVGFQTNIQWGDQERVLRMIPGLAPAEFVRFGQMHRNTYIDSPRLLLPTLQWRDRADLLFAGQITGTEGYVGSTAGGLLAGLNAVRVARGQPPIVLPPTTMMGALFHYVTHAEPRTFQPMKANFGLMPELEAPVRDKRLRHQSYAARALAALDATVRQVDSYSSSDKDLGVAHTGVEVSAGRTRQ
jgi:methylenetetrahydrofolate--tRNA-(uracil-5-)-methyltransferase